MSSNDECVDKDLTGLLVEEGAGYYRAKRYEEALEIFNQIIDRDTSIHRDTSYIPAYIGKGNTCLQLGKYYKAYISFSVVLNHFEPKHISAHIGRGTALLGLERYKEALQSFKKALQLDAQIAQAYVGKGHALFALEDFKEAYHSYTQAIELMTDDTSCYLHVGDIFTRQCNYEKALQMYSEALQRNPMFILAHLGYAQTLFILQRYEEALAAYKQVILLDSNHMSAHIRIGDTLAILDMPELADEAYKKVLQLVEKEKDLNLIWFMIEMLYVVYRPANIQFQLIKYFVIHNQWDQRTVKALKRLSHFYEKLFDEEHLSSSEFMVNIQILHNLLLDSPEERRTEVLSLITEGSDKRLAELLIFLAPYSFTGLTDLAHQLAQRWIAGENSDLGIRLYHALDRYSVPFEDSDWLFAQELTAKGLYIQVKSILSDLVKQHSTPERLWLMIKAMQHRQDPAQKQMEALQRFLDSTDPSDLRQGEAGKRLGDFLLAQGDDIAAIEAYKQVEIYGKQIPQLQAFRLGNWETFPALCSHPDYPFPPVVVLDLESDYAPDAAPGSRVFEIGAVRVKGSTELATLNLVIRRDFVSPKVAKRQHEAIEVEQAVHLLQKFIGSSTVVGHNIQAFDAFHLRAMGLSIRDEDMIDTLTFARLLYPDSIHHNLELLCHMHNITFQGKAHTALPDAQACAHLLHALGDELVRRGERLFAGFRAFVPPGSAFDRAILQPRNIAADPSSAWVLDPAPAKPYIIGSLRNEPASSRILEALETKKDALIERYDPNATYVQYLPADQRSIVTVSTQSRLERILAAIQGKLDAYVLPDPQTLLCPYRLRQFIEQAESIQLKLMLFCCYQASHNHDASVLYPLRFPSERLKQSSQPEESAVQGGSREIASLDQLRRILLTSCCASDLYHSNTCSAITEAKKAALNSHVLLATHESFLNQQEQPCGDLIIVDDADELQMHFAEYVAECLTSEQSRTWVLNNAEIEALKQLENQVVLYVREHIDNPGFHERRHLQTFIPYLICEDGDTKSAISALREAGPVGEEIASRLERFCHFALREGENPEDVHAYWLDLSFVPQAQGTDNMIEEWRFCGLSRNLQQIFEECFWRPYKQHIICGSALSIGAFGTIFIKRFFGLPEHLAFVADDRPSTQVYIPKSNVIPPASFLAKRSWAEHVGLFLYQLAMSRQQSLMVTLYATPVAGAFASTFKSQEDYIHHQVLSPFLGWTTAKIAERLADADRATMTFASPSLRKSLLDDAIDIEVTGPIRFLNQRDPLVAAQLRVFAHQYKTEGYMNAYLLPQALLELKSRVSSSAKQHIILDSSLRAKVYRDEVFSLFKDGEIVDSLEGVSGSVKDVPDSFLEMLSTELEQRGFSADMEVSDEDLHMTLKSVWETDSFRTTPLDQKVIVRKVFEGKDQLVVAATGGGKSLCFQLPAVLMAQDVVPRVTLVFSPLIALMRDQVEALQRKGIFSAIVLDSMLSPVQQQNHLRGIQRGDYSIIYIAPEKIRSSQFLRALEGREVGLIAFDEAHCVSQWGHDFRTDYFAVKRWVETSICRGRKRNFPVLALTATAHKSYKDTDGKYSEKSTIQDIIENAGLRVAEEDVEITSPVRPELVFRVKQVLVACPNCRGNIQASLGEIKCSLCGKWSAISEEDVKQAKIEILVSSLLTSQETGLRHRWERRYGQRQRGLIYCAYRRTAEEVASLLGQIPQFTGLRVGAYHAGMAEEQRLNVYQRFMSDDEDGLDIVVATNAFGMGIDARRLGFVIHFDIPATPEAYYQEAGRAGRDPEFRDGKDLAQCILLYHESDLERQRWLASQNKITEQQIETVYEALCKLKSGGEQEILVTERAIRLLSGFDEKVPVMSILYYLEHYTKTYGKSLIARGESANHLWQLKFEEGYQQRMRHPAIGSLSRDLLEVFCTSDAFGLCEEQLTIINANDLVTYLGWKMSLLKGEVENLIRRHIIVSASRMYMRWARSYVDVRETVKKLDNEIVQLLVSVEDQEALQSGKRIYVHLQSLHEAGKITAVPLHVFIRYLSLLAHTDIDCLRLFTHFELETRHSQPGYYKLQLRHIGEVKQIREGIRERLYQTVDRFCYNRALNEWQFIDVLKEAPDYEDRQLLQRQLALLEALGLVEIRRDEEAKRDIAMRIIFQQESVTTDQLDIDLRLLRKVEWYRERKLELMREYAAAPQEQRTYLLNAYFLGETPLIEPFVMPADFTKRQQRIVQIARGYHLVDGPAGSGKTTVLLEHVRYLVEHKLVPANRILVATHFNSAIDRISKDTESLRKNRSTIETMTLNALGKSIFTSYRILLTKSDGQPYYPEDRELKLVTGGWQAIEEQERSLVQETLARMKEGIWVQEPWPVGLEASHFLEDYEQDVRTDKLCLRALSLLREHGIFPGCNPSDKDIRSALKGVITQKYDAAFYYAIYLNYLPLLGEQGKYTYEDQILYALAILKMNPDIARRYQRSYEHIIIDEFQDFTPAEAELIGLLSGRYHSVLAFGDQRQDIRVKESRKSSLEKNFERLNCDNQIHIHHLKINFRSVQEILDFANAIWSEGTYLDMPQKAARGYRGEKPVAIRVYAGSTLSSVQVKSDDMDDNLLYMMVDAALNQLDLLPPSDNNSAALMVAKEKWFYKVQVYLREQVQRPFSVLRNTYRYQSHNVALVLTYFRLILDRNQDDAMEQLLRDCLVPYFDSKQIKTLKKIAKMNEQSLVDTVLDSGILQQVGTTQEQEIALQQHIAVLDSFCPDSRFSNVWQAVSELQNNPIAAIADQEQKAAELEAILKEFGNFTVKQALERIDSYISFIDEHRTDKSLVITTIDHAKSQAFDTVFLLGADLLKSRNRWYVSISRARQRFFFLINGQPPENQPSNDILSPRLDTFFDEIRYPEI